MDRVLLFTVWVMDEFPVTVMFVILWCLVAGGDGGVDQDVPEVFVPSVG